MSDGPMPSQGYLVLRDLSLDMGTVRRRATVPASMWIAIGTATMKRDIKPRNEKLEEGAV